MLIPSTIPNQQYFAAFAHGVAGVALTLLKYDLATPPAPIPDSPPIVLGPTILGTGENAPSPGSPEATLATRIVALLGGAPTLSVAAALTAYVSAKGM